VTPGTVPAQAAKGATSTIPIVFMGVGDPVGSGLVASLARPGGNLTGFSNISTELNPKRFELLSELVPQAKVIALLVNPNQPNNERVIGEVQEAARTKGVQPTAKATSMPPSPPSSNCMPARSFSAAIRSSSVAASNSWRWHQATPFRRAIRGASLRPRAG
jgi:ABC-type uncharacterized transport system substrate-binding protein